jgi:hypothetical protein
MWGLAVGYTANSQRKYREIGVHKVEPLSVVGVTFAELGGQALEEGGYPHVYS